MVIAIIALLISILLPAIGSARRLARATKCQAGLNQMSTGWHAYGADSKGWLAAFSWKPDESYSQWSELNGAGNPTDAHCNQAADIVRRNTGYVQPKFMGRMVDRNFTHLILVDGGYFGGDRMPVEGVVCPEDRAAQLWQRTEPDKIEELVERGLAPMDSTPEYRQMYPQWSSYQLVPAVWLSEVAGEAFSQSNTDYRLYNHFGATRFVNRRIDEVLFPSQKVLLFDLFDRHQSRRLMFHAYPQAAQPLAFSDGSVQTKKTRDSNRGWDPVNPTGLTVVTYYLYRPMEAGDPPALSGTAFGDLVEGRYRWTRWGMRGNDFGAPEPNRRP